MMSAPMYGDGSWPGLMTYGCAACCAAAAYCWAAALCWARNCCCWADSDSADWGSGCPFGAPGTAELAVGRPGFDLNSCCRKREGRTDVSFELQIHYSVGWGEPGTNGVSIQNLKTQMDLFSPYERYDKMITYNLYSEFEQ